MIRMRPSDPEIQEVGLCLPFLMVFLTLDMYAARFHFFSMFRRRARLSDPGTLDQGNRTPIGRCFTEPSRIMLDVKHEC